MAPSLVSVLHTFELVETNSLKWWQISSLSTIPPSPHPLAGFPFGPTPCTTACPTNATVTPNDALPGPTPFGRWSSTNWIVVTILISMKLCLVVTWFLLAPIFKLLTNLAEFWDTTSIAILKPTGLLWVFISLQLGSNKTRDSPENWPDSLMKWLTEMMSTL